MLPLFWPKKNYPKIVEIAILVYFDGFSAKTRVIYYASSILRPCLESSHQTTLLDANMKENLKIYFF